jgi:hypothetical protein
VRYRLLGIGLFEHQECCSWPGGTVLGERKKDRARQGGACSALWRKIEGGAHSNVTPQSLNLSLRDRAKPTIRLRAAGWASASGGRFNGRCHDGDGGGLEPQ